MKTYDFIVDPGHGWLKVPLSEIEGMTFSGYSYRDSKYAYLEEDCDAPAFMKVRGLKYRVNVDFNEVYVNDFRTSGKWSI